MIKCDFLTATCAITTRSTLTLRPGPLCWKGQQGVRLKSATFELQETCNYTFPFGERFLSFLHLCPTRFCTFHCAFKMLSRWIENDLPFQRASPYWKNFYSDPVIFSSLPEVEKQLRSHHWCLASLYQKHLLKCSKRWLSARMWLTHRLHGG